MVERRQAGAAAPTPREKLMAQMQGVLRGGGKGLQGAAVGSVRALLPLVELYAARRVADEPEGDQKGTLGFKRGENAVLRAAGRKAFLEMLEIASHTHPAYEGAPTFSAAAVDGRVQTPHLAHLLALAAAIQALLAAEANGDGGDGDGDNPAPNIPPEQSVVFIATAPGEYVLRSGPMTPRDIRRIAMRQRSLTPPPPAVLASAANARELRFAAAEMQPAQALMKRQTQMQTQIDRRQTDYIVAPALSASVGGCACGRPASSCQCGSRFSRSLARYDKDGDCASVFDISCETRWRVRECFKVALCDMLRCLGDELCEDGRLAEEPDLGACLEGFLCSVLTCLPDAICPPPAKPCSPCCTTDSCLPAPGASSCGCNYAVGE